MRRPVVFFFVVAVVALAAQCVIVPVALFVLDVGRVVEAVWCEPPATVLEGLGFRQEPTPYMDYGWAVKTIGLSLVWYSLAAAAVVTLARRAYVGSGRRGAG